MLWTEHCLLRHTLCADWRWRRDVIVCGCLMEAGDNLVGALCRLRDSFKMKVKMRSSRSSKKLQHGKHLPLLPLLPLAHAHSTPFLWSVALRSLCRLCPGYHNEVLLKWAPYKIDIMIKYLWVCTHACNDLESGSGWQVTRSSYASFTCCIHIILVVKIKLCDQVWSNVRYANAHDVIAEIERAEMKSASCITCICHVHLTCTICLFYPSLAWTRIKFSDLFLKSRIIIDQGSLSTEQTVREYVHVVYN